MSLHDDADHLRRRAAGLRDLAARLSTTPALRLDDVAGPDTWRTPRADLCRQVHAANRTQLLRAIEDLHHRARRLDRRAHELEALGAVRGPVA